MKQRFCELLPPDRVKLANYTWSMYSFFGKPIKLQRFDAADAAVLGEFAVSSVSPQKNEEETLVAKWGSSDKAVTRPRFRHIRTSGGEFVTDGGGLLLSLRRTCSLSGSEGLALLERLYREKEICLLGDEIAVKLQGSLSRDEAGRILSRFSARAEAVGRCLTSSL